MSIFYPWPSHSPRWYMARRGHRVTFRVAQRPSGNWGNYREQERSTDIHPFFALLSMRVRAKPWNKLPKPVSYLTNRRGVSTGLKGLAQTSLLFCRNWAQKIRRFAWGSRLLSSLSGKNMTLIKGTFWNYREFLSSCLLFYIRIRFLNVPTSCRQHSSLLTWHSVTHIQNWPEHLTWGTPGKGVTTLYKRSSEAVALHKATLWKFLLGCEQKGQQETVTEVPKGAKTPKLKTLQQENKTLSLILMYCLKLAGTHRFWSHFFHVAKPQRQQH